MLDAPGTESAIRPAPTRRTVLLHGGVYTASRILNQGAAFLLLPLYAHLLGSHGVGVVEVLNVARSFLLILLAQGLDAAWFRLRFEMQDKEELRRFESSVIWYLLGSAAFGLLLLFLFGDAIGPVLTPGVPFVPLGLWAACTAAGTLFVLLLERRYQAEQRPTAFALFSLARTLGTVGSIVVFVAILRRGAPGKIQAEAIAALVFAAFAIAVLRPGFRASGADVKRALSFGWPLVPHAFAGLVNDLLDRFFLNALLGLHAVGVYSMGYRIAGIGMMVTVAVNQAFAPVFIETLREVEREDREGRPEAAESLRKKVASIGFFTIVIACAVAQAVTAGAKEVLLLATTVEFRDSWRVVALVSGSIVPWAWYATLSQSLTYRPATIRRLPLITIAAALANALANYVLIPRLGMDGAAWATLLSNTVMGAGALLLGMKSLPLPYAWRRWIAVTAWTGVSLSVMWQLDRTMAEPTLRAGVKLAWLAASLGITLAVSGMQLKSVRALWARRGK